MGVWQSTYATVKATVNHNKEKGPASVLMQALILYGSPDWTRTSDPRINSPLLYQLSYRGIVARIVQLASCLVNRNHAIYYDYFTVFAVLTRRA